MKEPEYAARFLFALIIALICGCVGHNKAVMPDSSSNDPVLGAAIKKCDKYLKLNDFDNGLACLDNFIKTWPGNISGYMKRGRAWIARGDSILMGDKEVINGCYNLAIEDFTRVLEIDPVSEPAFINRGISSLRKFDYLRARADFTRAIEINPENAENYFRRGQVWDKLGDVFMDANQSLKAVNENFNLAIKDFFKAMELDPAFARVASIQIGLTFAARVKGDPDQAIAYYTRLLEINPGVAPAYIIRGAAWDEKGEYLKALDDFEEGIALNQEFESIYGRRGVFWKENGDYKRSIAYCSLAIEKKPRQADLYYLRAVAWRALDNIDQALKDIRKAHLIAPYNMAYGQFLTELEKKAE
jgi:tetratricopeptide (TPR) repeat protein